MTQQEYVNTNFIEDIIIEDRESGKHPSIHTRFPPEPNGYLHIGHAKSICLNFGLAQKYNGLCNLRMDDTNPSKEDEEYVQSIINDIKWLGFDWDERFFFASDYFEELYKYACQLIEKGLAYVCELTPEEVRKSRGTLTESGTNSPFRNRTAQENLAIFHRMRAGEYPEGSKTLRVKIDMTSPNINMRDPIIYRISYATHHKTGNTWCIYPMYDYAHCISDALEHITHSICTLEFEDHRPLYDWFVNQFTDLPKPRQIEFARLNITYTVMSKRKLLELVKGNYVNGWDDPRMPTLCGMRRRGYTPQAIRNFAAQIGVAKFNGISDLELLEHFVREDLNKKATRVNVVLNPLKVTIENFPEDEVLWLDAENNPEDETAGIRQIPFSKHILIEQDDFSENPPPKYFRLSPSKEIRLKHAFYITCKEVIKNSDNTVVEVICTYDPESKGGWAKDGRKVLGTSHWVSEKEAIPIEVRQYTKLFLDKEPENVVPGTDYKDGINKDSLAIMNNALAEPSVAKAAAGQAFQFLRQGYYVADIDTTESKPIFNLTVKLKDGWTKKK